jgi:hypothetical protein
MPQHTTRARFCQTSPRGDQTRGTSEKNETCSRALLDYRMWLSEDTHLPYIESGVLRLTTSGAGGYTCSHISSSFMLLSSLEATENQDCAQNTCRSFGDDQDLCNGVDNMCRSIEFGRLWSEAPPTDCTLARMQHKDEHQCWA